MTTVAVVCTAILGLSALITVVRIVRGPSMLDRAVATDTFIAMVAAAIGIEAVANDRTLTLPILVALALVGFLGSVAVARFAVRSEEDA
jgi:multicomponent Na+:H+ antiporter subunit F